MKYRFSWYFKIAVILVIASITYWAVFSINAYNSYHEYSDVGIDAYDMFYHVTYPDVVHGLQYLVFANHIAPDEVLVLPFYALYESSLTLLFVQDVVLSLTGLIVFFVVRDLLKSEKFALLFCFAYLVNPGMHGMLIWDYHAEFLITPFYLLAFYFLMKGKKWPFLASLLLLLGTVDTVIAICGALMLGIMAYQYLYQKDTRSTIAKERIRLAAYGLGITIAVFLFYSYIYANLLGAYSTNEYPGLPETLYTTPFDEGILSSLVTFNIPSSLLVAYYPYGLSLAYLGFGLTVLVAPILTIILTGPWLYGATVGGYYTFPLLWYQYFAYEIGPIIAASVLSMILLNQKKGFLIQIMRKQDYIWLKRYADVVLLTLSLIFLITSLLFSVSANMPNPLQAYFFQFSPLQKTLIAQLNSVVSQVPGNASVMTMNFVTAHLPQREFVEIVPPVKIWFKPEYILTDFNLNISLNAFSSNSYNLTRNYIIENNYSLIAQNGTAMLYKAN